MNRLTKAQIVSFAHLGVTHLIKQHLATIGEHRAEIRRSEEELARLRKLVPSLAEAVDGEERKRAPMARAALRIERPRRRMTPAQRKAVSVRMKRRWADWRKAQKTKAS